VAIREDIDCVFAPQVSFGIDDDACFVGTKTHVYVVPDAICAGAKGIRQALVAAMSDAYTVESCPIQATSAPAFIAELLGAPQTTLASLQAFLTRLKEGWEEMKAVEIATVKKLKVKAGALGGTVSVKYRGKLFYSTLVTRFKGGEKYKVKAFYDDVIRDKELFG
jgi:hypothetical protein